MIDIEYEIFNRIATKVRESYPSLYMTGEYVSAPPQFPCVSIIEIDNAVYRKALSSSDTEEYSAITYEVNVWSNHFEDKKQECKEIISAIDDEMFKLNFSRMMLEPVQNINDATVYRMVARYRAIVDKNHTIYRR